MLVGWKGDAADQSDVLKVECEARAGQSEWRTKVRREWALAQYTQGTKGDV